LAQLICPTTGPARVLPALPTRRSSDLEGSWASPAYASPRGGRPQVLFPGGDGWLYSLDPLSGKLIWKFDCNPKGAVFSHKDRRRSEEHTSELQSPYDLVCRLLLEKKNE